MTESEVRTADRIAPAYVPVAVEAEVPWVGDDIRIQSVDTFLTAPEGLNLVIVRVRTNVDGLEGFGCATFHQRAREVKVAIDEYLAPRVIGRSVHEITDIWFGGNVDSYWRGGPSLNSALAGIDLALWDIKGKVAALPVWQLLGGRVRTSALTYVHASGRDRAELTDSVEACIAAGYSVVRCQITVPGSSTYGAALESDTHSSWDPEQYVRMIPSVLEEVTARYGNQIRLLHDIHERVDPVDALRLLRALEPLGLMFAEDPVAPEDVSWLRRIREATTTPLALGELFTDMRTYADIVSNQLVDFVRCHVTALGGITPAWKLASLTETFGARTAWHGPRDVSPIGHAANLAMDIASPAFGIHEHFEFSEPAREIFPGTPTARNGVLEPSSLPGLGVTFDEHAARRYPPVSSRTNWHYSRVRRRDGSIQRP